MPGAVDWAFARMHFRRLASLVLGAWLAGGLLMMMVSTHNLGAVDRLLDAPSRGAANHIQTLGEQPARLFLRHQASELNRWYFETWERIQFGLGLVLLAALFFGVDGRPSLLLISLIMLVIVALQHWLMNPEMARLGRAIDFLPTTVPSADRTRFWNLHTIYSVTEVIKLGLGFVLAVGLLRRRRRRIREVREEIDSVDDADHGHVDG